MRKIVFTLFIALTSFAVNAQTPTKINGIWYVYFFTNEYYVIPPQDGDDSYSGDIIIPDSPEGSFCPVTGIAADAFAGSSVTSIELPSTIVSIGIGAFKNCANLQKIVCMATTPPTLHSTDIFDGISQDAVLVVPTEAYESYNTEPWSNLTIFDMDTYSTIQADKGVLNGIAKDILYFCDYVVKYIPDTDEDYQVLYAGYLAACNEYDNIATTSQDVYDAISEAEIVLAYGINALVPKIKYKMKEQLDLLASGEGDAAQQKADEGKNTIDAFVWDNLETIKFNCEALDNLFNTAIADISTATAIDNQLFNHQASNGKLFRNGQLYILRGEKVYTVTGQEVK